MEEKFKLYTIEQHAKEKAMWAGALSPVQIPDLLGMTKDLKVVTIDAPHTPTLLKIIDEIIVNASDHAKTVNVTKINVNFDKGLITVINDGKGIPVKLHEEATAMAKKDVYIPEVAFAYFMAGTNLTKPKDCIRGGINGLGAKLTNIHSDMMHITTIDKGKKYCQLFENGKKIINLPVITKTTEKDMTEVKFIPSYKDLGYTDMEALYKDLDYWMRLRVMQTSVYLDKVDVSYNGELCLIKQIGELGKILIDDNDLILLSSKAKSDKEPYKSHQLSINLLISKKITSKCIIPNLSIINGVITNKGCHQQHFKKMLSLHIDAKIAKLTKSKSSISSAEIFKNIRLMICGAIPNANWSGQRKDELQLDKDILPHYSIPATFLKQIADVVCQQFLTTKVEKIKVVHEKYTKANNAGKVNRTQTYLLAAEGDSAISLLRSGLTQQSSQKAGGPSFDWCGIISLQGVIINAAREISSIENTDGEIINIRSEKLQKNQRLLALADAFGLKYNLTYNTEEELSTLTHGKLILCVDQDLDGTGKIAPLVLVWIYSFWPSLISNGRIGRFLTPLIRVYEKKSNKLVKEFFYEEEFNKWNNEDNNYDVKYYKGLATHNSEEVKEMFKPDNFRNSIYIYTMDDCAKNLFNVYFGSDSSLRKQILITPVNHLTIEEAGQLRKTRNIPVGKVQLDIDTKSYKNDAIKRQIPCVVDGLNPARRKILMGSMMRLQSESTEIKVFQLCGAVADSMFYHHGDLSLNGTITYMAQSFIGARKFPYLIGVGQFGSRHGDKAGSARYISVKLSPIIKHIFPQADKYILPYVFEDGKRAEALYMVPILPMACLESYNIVSEGWNHESFGRKLNDVVNIVKDIITTGEFKQKEMKIDYNGDIRYYKNYIHSFGNYYYDVKTRTIVISDLPFGVQTNKFIETLTKSKKNDYIDNIINHSSTDKVLLKIVLKTNAIDYIQENYGNSVSDPVEEFLSLRTSFKPHLNYYSENGGVLEFENNENGYYEIIKHWFPIRAELYKTRITRQKILTELQINEESQILLYINLSSKLNLSKCLNENDAEKILQDNNFIKLNTSFLRTPMYTTNEELRNQTMNNASYDYLLNLRERDLLKSNANKIEQKIEKLKLELQEYINQLSELPTPCASVWLSEIEKFMTTQRT